jgi:competence protein ComEA
MPFRRCRPPTDLERVARILGAETAQGEPDGSGWVPDLPEPEPDGPARRVAQALDRAGRRADPAVDDVARLDADLRRARRPGLLTMPDDLRTGRRSVSSGAVVALLALVVAVGCVFVLRVLWSERSSGSGSVVVPGGSRPVEVHGARTGVESGWSGATGAGPGRAGSSGSPTASSGGPVARDVVVHVVGQVMRPGLVRLEAGARVADAIKAAGGERRGADLGALNLARVVVDGEQVHVPAPGEGALAGAAGSAGSSSATAGGGARSPGSSPGGVPVNLNTADVATLDSLPGVGPVLAQRILDWRTEHGRFTSVDELGEVSGIGVKLMAQLRPRVAL